jgi:lipoate-protein ligase A
MSLFPSARESCPAISSPLSSLPSPLSVRLLVDPPASGVWNMAVDEALLETAAADGLCTLRFYAWQEPTLSLGYFQTYTERWQHAASQDCAVVRRPSGGGAILHDRELTYSFVVPERHPLAVDRLGFYHAVHAALIEALAPWGVRATVFAPSGQSVVGPSPFLCFERRSPGDVLVNCVKIAGSAQRRCRGAVLQHGSVLLARSPAAPELDGVEELLGERIPPNLLIEAWLTRLSATSGLVWQNAELSEAQRGRADRLVAEKYASPDWTEKRSRVEIL